MPWINTVYSFDAFIVERVLGTDNGLPCFFPSLHVLHTDTARAGYCAGGTLNHCYTLTCMQRLFYGWELLLTVLRSECCQPVPGEKGNLAVAYLLNAQHYLCVRTEEIKAWLQKEHLNHYTCEMWTAIRLNSLLSHLHRYEGECFCIWKQCCLYSLTAVLWLRLKYVSKYSFSVCDRYRHRL